MNIEYHKIFIKNFKKRFGDNLKVKKQYKNRLKLFIKNPANPILKNHSLKGKKFRLHSFSITGDIRLVYFRTETRIVFLDIGTHNQVY